MPENLYDHPEFFARYSELRRSVQGLSGAPEWPSLQRMLPPLEGAHVIDLGCGFGRFCRYARSVGAASVLGIDISANMLARANAENDDPAIEYRLGSIDRQHFEPASFDLIFSSLALHYLPEIAPLFTNVSRALAPGAASSSPSNTQSIPLATTRDGCPTILTVRSGRSTATWTNRRVSPIGWRPESSSTTAGSRPTSTH